MLAGLRAAGLRPALFVYGRDRDTDVEFARQVAGGERLALDVIDKGKVASGEDANSPERQRADFVLFNSWSRRHL